MDLCHDSLALSSQLCIVFVRLRRDGGTESVVVVQQQLQTTQYHRSQARFLEFGLLADQHLHVVRDRVADRVYDCVEDSAGVRFVELRCEVGIDESLAVGDVNCADCSEDLMTV